MEKVAIIGHSFVRRLGEFLEDHPEKDPHFGMDHRRVSLLHCGGITMFEVRRTFEDQIRMLDPDWVVVVLGDNDADNHRLQVEGLATMIINTALQYLRRREVPVIVTNLMPRYTGSRRYSRTYNGRAVQVNSELRRQVQLYQDVSFWVHKFAVFPEDEATTAAYHRNRHLYKPDGVHLSEDGYFRYYRSLAKLLNGLRRQ